MSLFLLTFAAGGYRRLPVFTDVDRRSADGRRSDSRRARIPVQRWRTGEADQSTSDVRRAAGTHGSSRRASQHDRSRKFVCIVNKLSDMSYAGLIR